MGQLTEQTVREWLRKTDPDGELRQHMPTTVWEEHQFCQAWLTLHSSTPRSGSAVAPCDDRTANASDASAPICMRDEDDDFCAAKAVWERLPQVPGGHASINDVLYALRACNLVAAPPSDRAAVEGVSEAMENALHRAYWDAYHEAHKRAGRTIGGHAAGIRAVIAAYARARASDTNAAAARHVAHADNQMPEQNRMRREHENAAAAPVGQAVDDIIAERDHCEEVIDEILDCVLGTDRPEWSSSYGYADAIRDVENMTTPRAAYRQPTIEDAEKLREHFVSLRMVRPARDDEPKVAMLAAIKHIGCVIPADRGEGETK